MSEPVDLLERINVMLFHFDQRLGPRLLFHIAEIKDTRITSSITRLMDFNFLQEMKAFVNAMANVVYSSMFFSIPNPIARGGVEQFMISVVIFDPTITEYLMTSSIEEEMTKAVAKLLMLSELFVVITYPNPSLTEFPEVSNALRELRDNVTLVFKELFYGQIEGQQDPISQILEKIGKEAGKKLIGSDGVNNNANVRNQLSAILKSPIIARWGRFSLMHFDPSERVASVSVKNSLWTDSLGVIATKTCAFVEGMLESIFSKIFEENIICNETRCSSEYSYVQECLFQISPSSAEREKVSQASEQALREMGIGERDQTKVLIKEDIGLDIYQQLDPMIRLIQLFNKAPFISDFYFDESKFLIVCGYWKYPNEIVCHDCQHWIATECDIPVNLIKTKHRICELTYEIDEEKEDSEE